FRLLMSKTFTNSLVLSLALLPLLFTSCGEDDQAFDPGTEDTGYLVTAEPLVIEAGKSIAYRDASVGGEVWAWEFEGGDPFRSSDRAITTVYPEAGSYLTTLITYFTDGTRRRFSLRPRVLPRIEPDFTVASRQNPTGTAISFTNQTTGIGELPASLMESSTLVSYEWSFPGGTPSSSTDSTPSITYTTPGTYDVSLKVTRSVTESEETISKAGFIVIE
ncbi:MAG: PKD domain-containing protein, partial [Bacteroidota bacterium]